MAFWAHCRRCLGNRAPEADTGIAFVFCGRTLEPLESGGLSSFMQPSVAAPGFRPLQASFSSVARGRIGPLHTGPSKDSPKRGLGQSLVVRFAFYHCDKGHRQKQLRKERLSLLGLCFRSIPEGQSREERCSLDCTSWLAQFAFLHNPGPPT